MSVPIIPRKTLFGNPDRAMVQISPDGAHLSWLAPRDGVLNVWVAPRGNPGDARPVTQDTGRGIRFYGWAFTSRHILFIQDKNGDENWRLYAVDLESLEVKDLTPFEGVQAQIQGISPQFPEELIVGLNNRDPQYHDIYRINLVSGEMDLLLQNERFMAVMVDDDYRLRLALQMMPDGGIQMQKPDEKGGWEAWESIPAEDALVTNPVAFDKAGQSLFLQDSRGRNTAALVAQNLQTGAKTLLAEDPQADVNDVVRHPTQKHVQAVSFVYQRKRWQILDPAIQVDLDALRKVADGEVEILSRTLKDDFWA